MLQRCVRNFTTLVACKQAMFLWSMLPCEGSTQAAACAHIIDHVAPRSKASACALVPPLIVFRRLHRYLIVHMTCVRRGHLTDVAAPLCTAHAQDRTRVPRSHLRVNHIGDDSVSGAKRLRLACWNVRLADDHCLRHAAAYHAVTNDVTNVAPHILLRMI